ncbi:MAG: hypothetical protein NT027_12355 [Proteobacteria bacterium]|nr:hypothetical protein [Pseudomonadota bacterium]
MNFLQKIIGSVTVVLLAGSCKTSNSKINESQSSLSADKKLDLNKSPFSSESITTSDLIAYEQAIAENLPSDQFVFDTNSPWWKATSFNQKSIEQDFAKYFHFSTCKRSFIGTTLSCSGPIKPSESSLRERIVFTLIDLSLRDAGGALTPESGCYERLKMRRIDSNELGSLHQLDEGSSSVKLNDVIGVFSGTTKSGQPVLGCRFSIGRE